MERRWIRFSIEAATARKRPVTIGWEERLSRLGNRVGRQALGRLVKETVVVGKKIAQQ